MFVAVRNIGTIALGTSLIKYQWHTKNILIPDRYQQYVKTVASTGDIKTGLPLTNKESNNDKEY